MEREQLRQLVERIVREELAKCVGHSGPTRQDNCRTVQPTSQRANEPTDLVTATEVEAAAKGEKRIVVAKNAIVTPLARDRARELGVELID